MRTNRGSKKLTVSWVGVLFILLGIFLLLNKLSLIHFRWSYVLWGVVGLYGLGIAIVAFTQQRAGSVFWGSLFFFISVGMIVHKIWYLESEPWNYLAVVSMASGFAFLMMYVIDIKRYKRLIAALVFGAYGIVYYLWQFDVLQWYDISVIAQTYWPVLLIVWGLSILLPQKKKFSR
ncbi:MAG: hypothetical protein N3A63_07745 [Bacteroidetes bacterium]|nr:hypothetical protein [Bacteroidota bacterium]